MRSWWLLGWISCAGGPDPEPLTCDDAEAPTWGNFAQGYVQTWCTSCHTATLPLHERQGSPEGITFDSYAEVLQWAPAIRGVAVGEYPAMPPLGGVRAEDVALFELWLQCGAPGEDGDAPPCDDARDAGVAAVATPADAEALCAEGMVRLEALDVTGDAQLDCVCEVTGALTISGGRVSLPRLREAGTVRVQGAAEEVLAPALVSAASVEVDAGGLERLDLSGLSSVSGALVLTGGAAERVWWMGLEHAGSLVVTDAPALASLRFPRLRTVDGELRLQDLPALASLAETNAVVQIGGDLVLERLGVGALEHWAFSFLEYVGGDVLIADNPSAADLGGFTLLGDPVAAGTGPSGIAGSLTIQGNPSLRGITGFDTLRGVGGGLEIRGNDALEGILGFKNLAAVQGGLVLAENPELEALGGLALLTEVTGALVLEANAELDALDGLDGLRDLGAVRIDANPELTDLGALRGVRTITGDVTVTGNASLRRSEIDAWLEAVGKGNIGGAIVVSDNRADK